MAYTVTQLISRAWYLSGIVSRKFQKVSADQISEGLQLLNALLAIKTANNRLIPYYTSYTLTAVIGQESYAIPNLIDVESITFNLQTVVRFSMEKLGRKDYFGSPRVNNINALPFTWHIERSKGGATLYIYFLPNDNYPITIIGKFALSSVTINQDLSLTLDNYYIEYLRYALAGYMCEDNDISIPQQVAAKLAQYEEIITDVSPIDLTTSKMSTLQSRNGMNWAYVNFPGWTP